jgi:septal ring factor EnvC (AmiA/AmiB activator)
LLSTLVPEIRIEAQALASQLEQLISLKTKINEEKLALQTGLTKLNEERKRLDLLIAKKSEEEKKSRQAIKDESAKTEELALKAKSLNELIASMEREIEAARQAVQDAKESEKQAIEQEIATKKQKIAALKNAARLSPAIPFDKIKGLLRLPVEGSIIKQYGSANGFGGKAEGLSLATRSGAQVTSPADGWVVYSGPFRSFGKLLIINAGGGYHILLAGLENLTAEVGQFILANEPIGQMKETKLAQSDVLQDSASRPVLYLELRKDGVAIDPAPWWTVALKEKADG